VPRNKLMDQAMEFAERIAANSDDPTLCVRLAPRAEAARASLSRLGHQMAYALWRVPPEHRRLFTSQDELRYFAERFDFEVGGVIAGGAATDPRSGSDRLTDLAEAMQADGIDAVFTDSTESKLLAETLTAESGMETEVIALPLCSLGEPGSGTETYVEMMWTIADRIAEALA